MAFNHDRKFVTWLNNNNCSVVVSCYRKHKLFCIGRDGVGEISTVFVDTMRPMGLATHGKTIYASNIGNIIRYVGKGEENHPEWGYFDENYYPQNVSLCGDNDIHDLKVASDGTLYYVSALFNCICKPSMTKSFETVWIPPWITPINGKPPCEDRCHLNGLCLVNDKPRFVTAACTEDYYSAWRDHQGEGVVYDIVNNEFVCEGLWAPHSPRWYNNRLWIGEAGTGHFGYIDLEKKKFIPVVFIPGFIRGITFINKYAIINTSMDRHDYAFKDLPLGHIIEKSGHTRPIAGFHIFDLHDGVIKHHFEFLDPKTELYDIVCLKGVRRPRIVGIYEKDLSETFHLD